MYRLRAKRTTGSTAPGEMLFGELAYSDENQQLYIGRPTGPPATFQSDLTPIADEIGSLATITLDQAVEIATLTSDLATLNTSQSTQDTAIGALITAVATQGTAIDAFDAISFSGAYADLTGKPTLFSGVYGDLTGIPSTETTTQLNARDTANRARANHTGTQAAATISDFTAAAAAAAPVQSVAGRAGGVILAKADVGLAAVDNTSDASKPISTATQAALDLKAAVASIPPCLLGHPQFLPYPITLSAGLYTDPAGWLWYAPNGGSIGSSTSGATVASVKLETLYAALWAHLGLATAGWSIQTSAGGASTAGASAAADWAANKRLIVPDQRGRGIVAAGQGSGLTNRAVGAVGGAETHPLTAVENGPHTHSLNILSALSPSAGSSNYATGAGGSLFQITSFGSSGSGTAHNNMQPWTAYTLLWFTGVK